MRFHPLDEKALLEANLIPEGFYKYKILEAAEEKSQAGSDMIKLKIEVYVGNKNRILNDYLLEAFLLKLNHFCKTNNLMEKYDAGTLTASDCRGRNEGWVEIHIQKDKNGKYADKSAIKDYVLEPTASKSKPPVQLGNLNAIDPEMNDDVPF